jgi:hypothetical protein
MNAAIATAMEMQTQMEVSSLLTRSTSLGATVKAASEAGFPSYFFRVSATVWKKRSSGTLLQLSALMADPKMQA